MSGFEYVLYFLFCFIVYTYYKQISFTCALIKHFILKPMYVKYFNKIKSLFKSREEHVPTIKKLKKNLYEITYFIGETEYKLRTSKKRGPKKIMLALNEDGTDVTDLMESYSGPCEDFHGQLYTPEDLGFKQLHIFCQEQEFMFNKDDKIDLNLTI